MGPELCFFLLGIAVGWLTAHFYYLRTKADLKMLESAMAEAISKGIVQASRNSKGQITEIKIPSPITDFRVE